MQNHRVSRVLLQRVVPYRRGVSLRSAVVGRPQVQLAHRYLSAEPEKEPVLFKYPKAQDLFERITATLTKEDIRGLQNEIDKILGRTFRKNEFYYRGFGGRKVGKKKGAAGATEQEEEEEAAPAKTLFDLKLVGYDAKAKIKVIKEVRSIAGLGLKEAKEMVESAPKVIQKDLKPEQAEELKKKLEDLGATIELA